MAKKTRKQNWLNDLRLASIVFVGIVALIAAAAISTVSYHTSSHAAPRATVYTTDQWNSALEKVIHSDVTQSATLPNGSVLWIFGDTVQVNGVSTSGAYGYPHDAFATQVPNTLTFTATPGMYGYGWQQVPNWSDGTYFWFSTPIVYNNTVYVLGERVQGVNPFTVVGNYVATFNAKTLAYQNIYQVPAGSTGTTVWGGVTKTATGWWITGTHGVSCYIVNCKVGDMAFVPLGKLTTSSAWKVYNNVIPATNNLGTTLGLVQGSTGWDIFTKAGDAYGGTQIEKLTSASLPGTWTVTNKWDAPSPTGTVTYGVAVHPEQASPQGQILVSYDVNGNDPATHPLFFYLPK